MSTELVYLEAQTLLELDAEIEALGSDARGAYLVLDRTVIYPQGGGQPSDRGEIQADSGEFPVRFAGFVEGSVRHYGSFEGTRLDIGVPVRMTIDEQRRQVNALAHTAGHLVASVVEDVRGGTRGVQGLSLSPWIVSRVPRLQAIRR